MDVSLFNRILVPYDFSEACDKALKVAKRMRGSETTISAVHVLPALDSRTLNLIATTINQVEARKRTLRMMAERINDISIHLQVLFGDAADEIVKHAASTQVMVIVMPAKSHSPLEHLLLGSVTTKVVQLANCPVLVLPASFV